MLQTIRRKVPPSKLNCRARDEDIPAPAAARVLAFAAKSAERRELGKGFSNSLYTVRAQVALRRSGRMWDEPGRKVSAGFRGR